MQETSYENTPKTRAQIAVERARVISEKNQRLAEDIKSNNIEAYLVDPSKLAINKEKIFYEEEAELEGYRIKTEATFKNFIKDFINL